MVVLPTHQATLQLHDGSGDTPSFPRQSTLADRILHKTQYLYALVLLVAFVSLAAWYSVYNAKRQDDVVHSHIKGPGGKPLPITRRKKRDNGERKIGPHFGLAAKNVFRYLAAIVCLSYVGSSACLMIRAFWYEDPYRWSREGLPWAGESTVVRPYLESYGGKCFSVLVTMAVLLHVR